MPMPHTWTGTETLIRPPVPVPGRMPGVVPGVPVDPLHDWPSRDPRTGIQVSAGRPDDAKLGVEPIGTTSKADTRATAPTFAKEGD